LSSQTSGHDYGQLGFASSEGVAAIIERSPMLTRQARTREEYQQWCDFACAGDREV